MIRVLIADDQELVCDGIQTILKPEADIQVIGVAQDGQQAFDLACELKPDLVLMDLKMPVMSGITSTRLIVNAVPGVKVLALTTFDGDEWVVDAIRAGAAGYLLKDSRREEIVAAIRGTVRGEGFIDPAVAPTVLSAMRQPVSPMPTSVDLLTERELEILKMIAHGLTNQEIAARLNFTEGTIRNYVSIMFSKLHVSDRTQAAIFAWRYGLMNT